MSKLFLCVLLFSVFVVSSTPTQSSADVPAVRSSPQEQVRTLPAKIPRTWLRVRQNPRKQNPPASTRHVIKENTDKINGNEEQPNVNIEDLAAPVGKAKQIEIGENIPSVEDASDQDSSQELTDEDAIGSKVSDTNKPRNAVQSSPAPAKSLQKANGVPDKQSGRIQRGRATPILNSKYLGNNRRDSTTAQAKNVNFNEESSSNKSNSENTASSELKSESRPALEKSLVDNLKESSEETENSQVALDEQTVESKNTQSIEETSKNDDSQEKAGQNISAKDNHSVPRVQEKEAVEEVRSDRRNASSNITELASTDTHSNALHNKLSGIKIKPQVSAEHRVPATVNDSLKTNENMKVNGENDEKSTKGSEAESKFVVTNVEDSSEDSIEDQQENIEEPLEKQTSVKSSNEMQNKSANSAQPIEESVKPAMLVNAEPIQEDSKNSEASKLVPDDGTKVRNPLALFPEDQSGATKVNSPEKHLSSNNEKHLHNPVDTVDSPDVEQVQSSQSVHPKLKGKAQAQNPQLSKGSVISPNAEPVNQNGQRSNAKAIHPKLKRKPSDDRAASGSGKPQEVIHPKLKSKLTNSPGEETGDELAPKQGGENSKGGEEAHPKLVDANKQIYGTPQEGEDANKTDPMNPNGKTNGETVHPKMIDPSKQIQQAGGSERKSSKDLKEIDAKTRIEKLGQNLSKKVEKVSKIILDKASNYTTSVKKQAQLKMGEISEEIGDKESQEIVSAQSRREKSKQLSNMVASISIAIIVLTTIATVIGAIFKKLSFTRQRYGEHMPLSTEEDDDLPLYSRYQPPYESWKEML